MQSPALKTTLMTSKERVIAAMNFQEPDRVPRYFSPFWSEFKALWERVHGPTDLFTLLR